MGLFDFFGKNKNQPAKVADQLEALGYFKYADTGDVEKLKTEIGTGLAEKNYLSIVDVEGKWGSSLDLRQYSMDGEDLFEHGGIIEMLKEMDPTFKKMNIPLAISSHIEEADKSNGGLNHRITINGQPYVLFDKFDGYGWGEAAQRFADMVNDQLALLRSDERLYLINGGNDGRAVFLTESQQKLISSFIKDQAEKPMNVEEWCRVNAVERASIKDNRHVDQYLHGLHQNLSEEDNLSLSYSTGASDAQLEKLKNRFPYCPGSLLYLLGRINGTYHEQYGPHRVAVLILGSDVFEYPYYLKSVDQILEENSYGRSIRDIYEDYMDDMPELIEGPVDPDIKIDDWLCFSDCMNNGGTSSLYIDFNPAPGGTKGQVVRFLHDPDSYKVIARCFDEYLEGLIKDGYSFIHPEE